MSGLSRGTAVLRRGFLAANNHDLVGKQTDAFRLVSSTSSRSASSDSNNAKHALPQSKFFPANRATMLPSDSFRDKVVFITGGGTGLGKGMATKFSELGAKVAIAARRLPVLQETAKEISGRTGNEVLPLQCDIRDPEAISKTVDACVSHWGLPGVVVHNAAGNFISPTERLSPNAFKTIIDIVLNGTAYLTLDVGKRMIQEKTGGVFLAITTHYTFEGSGFVCPSACAKSGVETLMKSLGVEWGRHGIRMNCIAPGPIETEGAFSRLDPTGSMMASAIEVIPTGRLGEVEELANLATYLCSDYASWINSEVVTFDGGEFRSLAGEFSKLRMISDDQWDMLEKIIRASNKKQKDKSA